MMPKYGHFWRETKPKSKQWIWDFLEVLREKQEGIGSENKFFKKVSGFKI